MKPASVTTLLVLLSLCPFAQAQTITRHATRVVRPGYYRLETTCPVLTGGSPLARFANRAIADWARRQQQTFLTTTKQSLGGDRPRYGVYESQITSFSRCYSGPSLYSVGMEDYLYADGAHGGLLHVTFNFALVNGQPKRLMLADFFAPGSDYRAQVNKLLLARLRKDPRAVFIGEVTALTPTQLNRFVVEPGGLRFWFEQYEVAPYSTGPVDVKMTAAELGPDFRRNLIPAH